MSKATGFRLDEDILKKHIQNAINLTQA